MNRWIGRHPILFSGLCIAAVLLLWESRCRAANDFSGDENCVAVWNMENGALTTDSQSTNTLTNSGVVADTVNYKEAAASGDFERTTTAAEMTIANAGLSAAFPFKDGTQTQMTLCFWVKFESFNYFDPQNFIASVWSATNGNKVWYLKADGGGGIYLGAWDSGAGTSAEWVFNGSDPLVTDRWYFLALSADGTIGDNHLTCWIWDDTAAEWVIDAVSQNLTFAWQSGGALAIGSLSGVYTGGHDGLLDEVVVFNDLLTDEEVETIKDGGYTSGGNSIIDDWWWRRRH